MTGCREGRIARAPIGNRALVTIRSLTGDRLPIGPLPFTPHPDTTPVRGDRCWVLYDEDNQPACIAVWEPAT